MITLGLDGELVILPNHGKGWNNLKLPTEFKTKSNYEMYCYFHYCGMDADAIFIQKLKELQNHD